MIAIREFTDPTCPWAFSAEPSRLRLLWLYGEGPRFERRMIVLLTYETAIANLAPDPPRRDDPISVDRVLHWASEPLATVEVAEVMNQPADEVRRALTDLGATFDPVGPDGYGSLASAR